jgi:phosphatidylserine/phosphatidylglycerophosphate/cardiolipin synthase-like enzyme
MGCMGNSKYQVISVSLGLRQVSALSDRARGCVQAAWVCGCLAVWAAQAQTPLQTPALTASPGINQSLSQAEVVGIYFTPPSDVASAVIDVIDQSQKEVLVQAYGFTHNGIAQALVRANARGVAVKVLLDAKTDATNRYVTELLQAQQIPLRLDASHAIAHNKVIVVDGTLVITGSFNFTNSAQTRNAENLLVLKSTGLADSYKANWQTHWNHSR